MLSRHRVSRQAIELIKRFEGYRRSAAQLPDGRWTIGHGHTLTAREGAEVSESDAEALLLYDLISVGHAVNEHTLAPMSQNQFDALCCFTFNIGIDNFRRSQVLKRLNAGAAVQAACAMELWRKADFEGERIVVDALVRRRAAEKALFLTPDNGEWVAAPSPLLRPVIDLDALDLVPMRRPVEVQTSFVGDRVTAQRDDIGDEPPEAAPEPSPAVATAAEAVTDRLASLFADPGEEPAAAEAEAPPAAPDLLPDEPARPEADFAPPITTASDPGPDREPRSVPLPEPEVAIAAAAAIDPDLDIPAAPPASAAHAEKDPEVEAAFAAAFIPARTRPAPAKAQMSVVWDLVLALFGLAFFGFGIVWGMTAQPAPVAGLPTSVLVAWPAGVAGVIFFGVAVFRLLQRLGRELEQD